MFQVLLLLAETVGAAQSEVTGRLMRHLLKDFGIIDQF